MTHDSDTLLFATNPATGEQLQPGFAEASDAEVNAAVAAAVAAFDQTLDLPPRWPADFLDAIAERIMSLGDALLERGEAETALPRARLTGERARTVGQIKMFAGMVREGSWVDAVIDTADPARTPLPKPDLRRMLRPRGPIAVFGASNFPFAFGTLGGDTASALAAGCPVVVKGHPSHPGTSKMFADAVRDVIGAQKLPPGLFALLQGRRNELSAALVKHERITAVGFTGSLRAGRALFDLAAARPSPIPVFAEMGSVNPVVILPRAIAEKGDAIAQGLAASLLLGGGQFCTKPGLVFTIGDNKGRFVAALASQIIAQSPVTMLNANLRENFSRRIRDVAHVDGVTTVASAQSTGHASVSPALFATDAATFQRSPALHEEAFGPGAVVVNCTSLDDALACIDALGGNLTGTIHTTPSDPDAARILRHLEQKVGRVIVNGYPTGVEVCNAVVHGGPYPATTDPATTSVGSAAIRRWVRMTAWQDTPDELLPPALKNSNPLGIRRVVNGIPTTDPIRQ